MATLPDASLRALLLDPRRSLPTGSAGPGAGLAVPEQLRTALQATYNPSQQVAVAAAMDSRGGPVALVQVSRFKVTPGNTISSQFRLLVAVWGLWTVH